MKNFEILENFTVHFWETHGSQKWTDEGEKLVNSSGHFPPPPRHIFLGSNHSSFILGYVLPLDMHPRLLKNIYSMCTHQAHMGFDLKNKFWKNSKFWQKFLYVPFVRKYFFQIYFPKGAIYERIVVPNILSPYQT